MGCAVDTSRALARALPGAARRRCPARNRHRCTATPPSANIRSSGCSVKRRDRRPELRGRHRDGGDIGRCAAAPSTIVDRQHLGLVVVADDRQPSRGLRADRELFLSCTRHYLAKPRAPECVRHQAISDALDEASVVPRLDSCERPQKSPRTDSQHGRWLINGGGPLVGERWCVRALARRPARTDHGCTPSWLARRGSGVRGFVR